MADSFSVVSSGSHINAKSWSPEIFHCSGSSNQHNGHGGIISVTDSTHSNTSWISRSLGSELSCTNDKNSSTSQDNSDQTGHGDNARAYDYIGLTDVSSSQPSEKSHVDVNLRDTDLKLGLNLPLWEREDTPFPPERHPFAKSNPPNTRLQSQVFTGGMENARILTARDFQVPLPKDVDGVHCDYGITAPANNAVIGNKRRYVEAIRPDGSQGFHNDRVLPVFASVLAQPWSVQCNTAAISRENRQETPLINWAKEKHLAPSWNMGLEQSPAALGLFQTSKPSPARGVNHSGMVSFESLHKSNHRQQDLDGHGNLANNRFGVSEDPSTTKGQTVGWPPIRTYRRNSLGSHSKPSEDDQEGAAAGNFVQNKGSALYVKVNMDGVPIGRKVDLNGHQSYETLAQELEDMFQGAIDSQSAAEIPSWNEHGVASNVKPLLLLNPASDFVLTHEDKEGDCMLVGDVPWGMFVNTVKRLRIMKTSDSTILAAQKCLQKPKAA